MSVPVIILGSGRGEAFFCSVGLLQTLYRGLSSEPTKKEGYGSLRQCLEVALVLFQWQK